MNTIDMDYDDVRQRGQADGLHGWALRRWLKTRSCVGLRKLHSWAADRRCIWCRKLKWY